MIDRCAGQQHDFDGGKDNASKIPDPKEVSTSKRKKVRLKDILRNCMAQVNCPFVIHYYFFLFLFFFFGLQEFLMHLFEKDEV